MLVNRRADKKAVTSPKRLRIVAGMFVLLSAMPLSASEQDVRFASPSGNISCTLNDIVAACYINSLAPSFTNRPEDCEGDWGRYFYVLARGSGTLGCVTEQIEPPKTLLPYGQTLVTDGLRCTSQTTGMTCVNAQGGGFTVRRSAQRVF